MLLGTVGRKDKEGQAKVPEQFSGNGKRETKKEKEDEDQDQIRQGAHHVHTLRVRFWRG